MYILAKSVGHITQKSTHISFLGPPDPKIRNTIDAKLLENFWLKNPGKTQNSIFLLGILP